MIFLFIVKSRKEILWSSLFVATGLLVGVALSLTPVLKTFDEEKRDYCVVIDAGHGLPDGGAVGIGGSIEQKINLLVSKKIEEILKNLLTK